MNDDLDFILDDCLSRIQSGEDIESVLKRYPEQASQLRPLLQTALFLQAAPRPASRLVSTRLGRQKMLSAAAEKYPARPVSKPAFPRYVEQITHWFTGKDKHTMKRTYRFALVTMLVVAILLVVGGGVTAASASTLPGDTLYPVKTAVDDVRLFLTINPDAHQQLQQQIQQTRYNDITVAMHKGRMADVRFWGQLTAFNDSQWTVGGLTVNLDANTQVIGAPEIGAFVRVAANTQPDGSLLAKRLIVAPAILSTAMATVTFEASGTPEATMTMPPFPTFEPFPTWPAGLGTPIPVTPPFPPMRTPGAIRTLVATLFPTGLPTAIPSHEPLPTLIATYIATYMPTPRPTHPPVPTMIATYMPTPQPR